MLRLCAVLALLVATTGSALAAKFILYATAATPGRVDSFCVGADGKLASDPKQSVSTRGAFPRRLRVATVNGNQVLYAAEVDRAEAFAIGPHGALKPIGDTDAVAHSDPHDLWIAPENNKLYLPQRLQNRIVAYDLNADGSPQPTFGSCTKTFSSRGAWESVAVQNGLLYVSSQRHDAGIDVVQLGEGGVLTDPNATSATCGEKGANTPHSFRRELGGPRAFVLDGVNLYVRPRLTTPRVLQFVLDPDGTFCPDVARIFRPNRKKGDRGCCPTGFSDAQCKGVLHCTAQNACPADDLNPSTGQSKTGIPDHPKRLQVANSRTAPVLNYEDLVLAAGTNGNKALIGGSFDKGRVDSFPLDPTTGALPKKPKRQTIADFRIQAARMFVFDFPNGPLMLYVSTGDHDRVIGYRLDRATGELRDSTAFTQTGELKGSFPDDVVVVQLDGDCNGG